MIITSLSAENVLKYRSLELHNIPESGVIAISGQNESGKSTIGETVCFALFGRTFSIGEDEVGKIIRWGEDRCSVHLRFIADHTEYEIARFLDSDGNHGARITRAGDDEETPIAKGVEAVSDALYDVLGFQFEEFIESFYLAQREITTPHPHSHAVKTMAGISALEWASDELDNDIIADEEKIEEVCDQIETVEMDIAALEISEGELDSLRERLATVEQTEDALQARYEDIDDAGQRYHSAVAALRSAKTRKRFTGFLSFLAFIGAVLAGVTWYMLTYMPDAPQTNQLTNHILDLVPTLEQEHLARAGLLAAVLAGVFLFFWVSGRIIKSGIRKIVRSGENLAMSLDDLSAALPVVADDPMPAETATGRSDADIESTTGDDDAEREPAPMFDGMNPEQAETTEPESAGETDKPSTEALASSSSDDGETIADETPDSVSHYDVQQSAYASTSVVNDAELAAIRACSMGSEQASGIVSVALQSLRDDLQAQQRLSVQYEQAIKLEQDKIARAEALQKVVDSFREKLAEREHAIEIRHLAEELISGATRHLSHRFNRDLRDLVSATLPLFTDQRYEHLQIDEDLTVRVFSSEKRDFMDLDEISSGTQRQIMLAVRLALSQELVNTAVAGKQFVFLDEPFAFFDQARTRSSMEVLPNLSDEINQIWVIAQEFPAETPFDLLIECSRDYQSLPALTET